MRGDAKFPTMARLVEDIGSDQRWLFLVDTFAADHKSDGASLFDFFTHR